MLFYIYFNITFYVYKINDMELVDDDMALVHDYMDYNTDLNLEKLD